MKPRTVFWLAVSLALASSSMIPIMMDPPPGRGWVPVSVGIVGTLAVAVWVRVALLEAAARRQALQRLSRTQRDICARLMSVGFETSDRQVCTCGQHKTN